MQISGCSALLFLIFMLGACKSTPDINNKDGSTNELKTLENMVPISSEVVDFKLGFAEKNGITDYKVFRDVVNADERLDASRRYVVRIVFEPLTHDQYKLLMTHYGGQEFVPYEPDRIYQLIDFLPPKMQAYVNRWLIPTQQRDQRIPLDWQHPFLEGPVSTSVAMNCWTMAYEILREWGKPWSSSEGKLAYFGPLDAEKIMTRNEKAILSKESLPREDWEKSKVTTRNKGRKPGDLLEIETKYSTFGPAHVALWIDDDLYFEKTNIGSDQPIRLVFYSDVISNYLAQDDPKKPMTMDFIRFKPSALPNQESLAGRDPLGRNDLSPLPGDLKEKIIFTLDMGLGGSLKEFSANRILTFPIGRDTRTGRANLIGADLLKNHLISDELCYGKGSGSAPLSYKVTTAMQLFVFNSDGFEIARISGQKSGSDETLAEFPTSSKVLKVVKDGGTFRLVHPGYNEDGVFLNCARSNAFQD